MITPSYNCDSYILRSYQMLVAQSYPFWEWIVVDDGSSDETHLVFDKLSLADKRITYSRLSRNMGRGYARNAAIRQASSDVIVVWDVDDLYPPGRLMRIKESLVDQDYDFFYSDALIASKSLALVGASSGPPIRKTDCFIHPSLAFNRRVLATTGYSINQRTGEDFALMYLLLRDYNGFHAPDYLAIYIQDREVSPLKAIRCNQSHLFTLLRLAMQSSASSRDLLRVLPRYLVKLIPLACLCIFPPLYKYTLRFRGYGNIDALKLSDDVLQTISLPLMADTGNPLA